MNGSHETRHKPRHVVARRLRGNRDLAVIQARDQGRIVRRIGLEAGAIGEGAVDFRSLDDDVANVILVDFGQQLREGDVLRDINPGWREPIGSTLVTVPLQDMILKGR